MARDLSLEPGLPTAEIQGDILPGLIKRHEHLIFFEISDAAKFKAFLRTLHLTSMQESLDQRAAVAANKARGIDIVLPTPGLNLAFTFAGLQALGVPGLPAAPAMAAFRQGMHGSQAKLNDPPAAQWKVLQPTSHLHGVFLLTGATHAEVVDIIASRLAPAAGNGWRMRHEEVGQVRPDPVSGHEHFGYADGVSQPGVRGTIAPGIPLTPQSPGAEDAQGQKGQDLLWPGEFVFGFPGQDPKADSFEVKGPQKTAPAPFMDHGAYLVFRRLAQAVPEFIQSVKTAAAGITGPANPMDPDLLGAQMVGRWKSGAPIVKASLHDDLTIAEGTPDANAFEFGDDRHGLKCPWAAHVRKAYPRDDVPGDPGVTDELTIARAEAFTQTHRMMRRGIAFGPELTEGEALSGISDGGANTRGLLFKCYVTSIEEQFEFVQQSWCNEAGFSQPGSGIDPIIGQSASPVRPFLGAAPQSLADGDKPHLNLRSFVHLEGGAYFFAPSIAKLKGL